jgi:AraC-like DNA-binding protein
MTFEARVQELLQNHDLALDLEEVAQHLGMSSRQLRRYLTGESTNFRQILLKLKFTRAQALLEAGMPVSQVALQLGYTSAASFSRAFKKQTGIAPKFVNKTG